MKRLTTKSYWDNIWSQIEVPRMIDLQYRYDCYRLDKLFKKFFKKNQNKKILEVGASPGSWLIYFNKEFGYEVWGIDYSEKGCLISRKNLELTKTKGKIICEDIFSTTLKKESFDIVFSLGVIEHFQNPELIIEKHYQLLKKGGILIISVPNMNGLIGFLYKLLNKKVYDMHLRFTKESLKKYFLNLEILKCDYFGTWHLGVIEYKRNNWLIDWLLQKLITAIDKIIQTPLRYFNLEFESSFFSPYIIIVAKK